MLSCKPWQWRGAWTETWRTVHCYWARDLCCEITSRYCNSCETTEMCVCVKNMYTSHNTAPPIFPFLANCIYVGVFLILTHPQMSITFTFHSLITQASHVPITYRQLVCILINLLTHTHTRWFPSAVTSLSPFQNQPRWPGNITGHNKTFPLWCKPYPLTPASLLMSL